ncbi:dihydrofolate reductase family protein [Mailhella massiliensis]|uniref:Dihydrofolate reductase family protein n=1 Tax=Mailhella massiliensis TaxID=1903261 RepID=A0A921DQ40_9BACT|nr:dihydrofolate reductase family protein [Mailhella massiliensis]HJD96065.1 dihydrofolate reductase family protein [Mailhella massiliensis]
MKENNMQERPYVVCHMAMSLDGKVTGDFLRLSRCESALNTYYRINRDYAASAYACGRVTMEESFTKGFRPDLSRFGETVMPPMDHVADENASFFAVAFDRHGSLGWKGPRIEDEDPGYGGAHIIEVLCESVPQACLAYLHEMGVSYIFAGKDDIDLPLALHKLKAVFGIRRLLLEGGSLLNGSFLRADMVDELSLVVLPVTGNAQDKSLFDRSVTALFRLEETESLENGAAWLRFRRER